MNSARKGKCRNPGPTKALVETVMHGRGFETPAARATQPPWEPVARRRSWPGGRSGAGFRTPRCGGYSTSAGVSGFVRHPTTVGVSRRVRHPPPRASAAACATHHHGPQPPHAPPTTTGPSRLMRHPPPQASAASCATHHHRPQPPHAPPTTTGPSRRVRYPPPRASAAARTTRPPRASAAARATRRAWTSRRLVNRRGANCCGLLTHYKSPTSTPRGRASSATASGSKWTVYTRLRYGTVRRPRNASR